MQSDRGERADLNKAEVFRFDSEQKFVFEDGSTRVQRDVKAGNASVGRREVRIVGGADRHRRHRLEAFFRRRERWRAGPEVNL